MELFSLGSNKKPAHSYCHFKKNLEKGNLARSVDDIHKEKQFIRASYLDVRDSSCPPLSIQFHVWTFESKKDGSSE